MAFTPILSRQSVNATDQSGFWDFGDSHSPSNTRSNSPDSVESGEPLLDGVGSPRRLAVRISDAHRDRPCDNAGTQAHLIDEIR